MLVIIWTKATGAQMRSILLGVIVFKIVPIPKNTTTNQIPMFEIDFNWGSIKSARDITIAETNARIIIFMIATTLILGGYIPGNFPPIEAAPQGIPAAKHP